MTLLVVHGASVAAYSYAFVFSSVFLSLCSNERKSQLRLERQQKISTMNPIAKKHFQVISPPPDQTEASCPSLQWDYVALIAGVVATEDELCSLWSCCKIQFLIFSNHPGIWKASWFWFVEPLSGFTLLLFRFGDSQQLRTNSVLVHLLSCLLGTS